MKGRNTRRCTTALTSALLIVGTAACGSSAKESATPITVFKMAADPGSGLRASPGHRAALSMVTLRSTLDSLLSNHAQLVAELMHEVGAGHENTAAAINALAANTNSLTSAIAAVYGTDGGRAFDQLWEQHTQFFVDYSQAARAHDTKGEAEALDKLRDYQNDFGSFVATATGGRVPLLAVVGLLHGHVDDLTKYIQADIAGNSEEAAGLLNEAVAHMHDIAKAVADAIAAQHLKTVTG